jgi:hypothetical protein
MSGWVLKNKYNTQSLCTHLIATKSQTAQTIADLQQLKSENDGHSQPHFQDERWQH